MQVTVAICTWNRAHLLDRTLTRMRRLRIPEGVAWDLVVVNNDCTDETDEVIARHLGHLPIRRSFEPKRGLSHARNCAVGAASGDLINWTDDDVLVHPDWVAEYAAAALAWPGAAFFGGQVEPWFAAAPPHWIVDHIRSFAAVFAICDHGPDVRPLSDHELPVGANVAFRSEVLRRHPFNPELGRVGRELRGGEEVDVVRRLRDAGALGIWVGTAKVRHYIPSDRMNLPFVREWLRWDRTLLAREGALPEGPYLWGGPRWAWRLYFEALLKSWVYSPFRGPNWLRSFLDAARWRGVIDDCRARRRAIEGGTHGERISGGRRDPAEVEPRISAAVESDGSSRPGGSARAQARGELRP